MSSGVRAPPSLEMPMRASRGTTLVELMVGLVILTVLASIAMPGISSLMRRQNLRDAAEDVVFAATKARARARATRKAYGLWVGKGGGAPDGLLVALYRGTTSRCADVLSGQKVLQFDHSPGNALNNPWVQIVAKAPAEVANAGLFLCFTADGRVVRSDTSLPFNPPSKGSVAAGDVFFELQRTDAQGNPVGDRLQVQITYNGVARITHGQPLSQLQGSGQ